MSRGIAPGRETDSHMVIDDDYVFLSGLTAEDIQGGES